MLVVVAKISENYQVLAISFHTRTRTRTSKAPALVIAKAMQVSKTTELYAQKTYTPTQAHMRINGNARTPSGQSTATARVCTRMDLHTTRTRLTPLKFVYVLYCASAHACSRCTEMHAYSCVRASECLYVRLVLLLCIGKLNLQLTKSDYAETYTQICINSG